jgi:hypothetical protein
MKRICFSFALAFVAIFGGSAAIAAPPTVTPSPGYDARLQERRAAQAYSAPVYEPVVHDPKPLPRHHPKRVYDGAH